VLYEAKRRLAGPGIEWSKAARASTVAACGSPSAAACPRLVAALRLDAGPMMVLRLYRP